MGVGLPWFRHRLLRRRTEERRGKVQCPEDGRGAQATEDGHIRREGSGVRREVSRSSTMSRRHAGHFRPHTYDVDHESYNHLNFKAALSDARCKRPLRVPWITARPGSFIAPKK